MVADHRWRFMVMSTTVPAVTGTSAYTLPAATTRMHVESVRLAITGTLVPEMEWMETEELLASVAEYGAITPYGTPGYWTDNAPGAFTVFPSPSVAGTFTVRYLRQATELTLDADIPDIPKGYLDILVLGACAKLAARERKFDAATWYRKQADAMIDAMKGQYGLRQRQSARQVVSSGRYTPRDYRR